MPHLISALYLATQALGAAAIGISAVIYLRYRKPSLRFFTVFLLSLYSFLLAFSINHYTLLVPIEDARFFSVMRQVFRILGLMLFIGVAPYFYHSMMGRSLSRGPRAAAGIPVLLTAGLIVMDLASPGNPVSTAGSIVVLFGMIAYGLLYGVLNLPNIGDKTLRRAVFVFFLLTAVFFPFNLIDILMSYHEGLRVLAFMNNLAQPCYFLVLCVLAIFFCLKYFNEPVYREHGRLTRHFKTKFKVTKRECEIIERILAGESSRTIGVKLFISTKTVENHAYNIFRKCDIKNRLQLHQLVSSNMVD